MDVHAATPQILRDVIIANLDRQIEQAEQQSGQGWSAARLQSFETKLATLRLVRRDIAAMNIITA